VVETAVVMFFMLLPLTLGLIVLAEAAWTYHALVTLTRQGVQYAATHCFLDPGGSNVVAWMQANAPPFLDRPQLAGGQIQINVSYWTLDQADQLSIPFDGSGCAAACSPSCSPDAVTVGISGYQFMQLLPTLAAFGATSFAQGITVPSFSTTVEVEGAGGDAELGTSSQ